MHDGSPWNKALSPGRGQLLVTSVLCRERMDDTHYGFFLSLMCQVASSHSVPLNFVVFLRCLFHSKTKCTEEPSLDFIHSWLIQNRRFELFLVGRSLAFGPSGVTNRLLLQRYISLFLLLCFCCSTLHLIRCWELVSGVCWATHGMQVQWHVVHESSLALCSSSMVFRLDNIATWNKVL